MKKQFQLENRNKNLKNLVSEAICHADVSRNYISS